MLNMDYNAAIVGANSPKALGRVARSLARNIATIRDKGQFQVASQHLASVADKLTDVATHNVDVASKAGLLPSRYLGVDSEQQTAGGIAAGGTLAVASQPTVEVRPIGFRVDDTHAADFNIDNIRMATLDLLVGTQACPASMFTTGITLPPLSAPKLSAGSPAIVTVTNIAGAARRFRAGFPLAKLSNPEC